MAQHAEKPIRSGQKRKGHYPAIHLLDIQVGLETFHCHSRELGWGRSPQGMDSVMVKDKRRKPRWFQHFHAWLFAYFWLPCRMCGEYYGGHEAEFPLAMRMVSGIIESRSVCANCIDEVNRLNKKLYEAKGLGDWWIGAQT